MYWTALRIWPEINRKHNKKKGPRIQHSRKTRSGSDSTDKLDLELNFRKKPDPEKLDPDPQPRYWFIDEGLTIQSINYN